MPAVWNDLPDDLILEVVSLLSLNDLASIRRVSRYLYAVTQERAVWVSMYRKAPFLRHSGSTTVDSVTSIQQSLAANKKVDKSWTLGLPEPRRRKTLKGIAPQVADLQLVRGRWLIIAQKDKLSCIDLDSSTQEPLAQVSFTFNVWNIHCSKAGRMESDRTVYITVIGFPTTIKAVRVLKLHMNDAGVEFECVLAEDIQDDAVQTVITVHDGCLITDHPEKCRLLDYRSKQFYDVPAESKEAIRGMMGGPPLRRQHLVTDSHLIVIHNQVSAQGFWEAYPLPAGEPLIPSARPYSSHPALKRSHSGIIPVSLNESIQLMTRAFSTRPLDTSSEIRDIQPSFVLTVMGLHTDSRSVTDLTVAEINFITTQPNQCGEITLRRCHATQLHYPAYNIMATASEGHARACCVGWAGGAKLLAVTVREWLPDAAFPEVVVRGLVLGEKDIDALHGFSGSLAFDGFRGRLCVLFDRMTSEVEVIDYCG